MLKIDRDMLLRVGLEPLPTDIANIAMKTIYEMLEMRVGIKLADEMTNDQLDEFEKFFDKGDDAGAFAWLEEKFPNYKEIVQATFDSLSAEISFDAPSIREEVALMTRYAYPSGDASDFSKGDRN